VPCVPTINERDRGRKKIDNDEHFGFVSGAVVGGSAGLYGKERGGEKGSGSGVEGI